MYTLPVRGLSFRPVPKCHLSKTGPPDHVSDLCEAAEGPCDLWKWVSSWQGPRPFCSSNAHCLCPDRPAAQFPSS